MNELAEAFSQFDSTEELAEALEEGDFSQAAEALASLDEGATDSQTRQEMAEALQAAAQAAEQAGNTELAEALNEAAEALEQAAAGGENSQEMQEALQEAAQALSEAGQEFEGQEAVREALANIQEAREQLAEANGQGGTGQGQGQQPGLAQGEGQGGGAGREDPDSGADGLLAEQGAPGEMSTDNGPNEGRTGEYESIYAPLHLGGEGGPLVNPDPQGAEEGVPIGTTPADPNREPNASQVPYNQVYGQYNEAASRALDDSYIPLGMKSYVRNYFGALEPE
jgi:tetratricopeptide (TPR) repeat protein